MTPFNALYGQECLSPLNFSDPTIRVEASKRMIEEMTEQTRAIRKDIQAAQDRQKHYADLRRSERKFKPGDKIFCASGPKEAPCRLGNIKSLDPGIVVPMKLLKR